MAERAVVESSILSFLQPGRHPKGGQLPGEDSSRSWTGSKGALTSQPNRHLGSVLDTTQGQSSPEQKPIKRVGIPRTP